MKKLYLILSVIAGLMIGTIYTVHAAPITPPTGGGTGIGTTTSGNNGLCLTQTGVFTYGFASCGGSASGTFTNVYGTSPIVVATGTASATVSCPTCYLTSNPSGYITTSTNNFGGLTGSGTSTYVAIYNSSGTLKGFSNFTFTSSTNTLTLTGPLFVTGTSTFSGNSFFSGGTVGGAVFGSGSILTLGSDAYMQATGVAGENVGFFANRATSSSFVSYDLITGDNINTGFSMQLQPSDPNLHFVNRIAGTDVLTLAPSGATVTGNVSTTNLTITSITGTQCLHSVSGIVSGVGSDCGSGGGIATTTPYVNGNIVLASGTALSTFGGSTCGGSTFQNGISASGTALCGTPAGGSSSTNVFGINGVTTTQTGVNATASLDTTYAASWSALETFLKGATINGTTTLASTTNALVLTNGSGTVLAYAGSSCGGGQAPNGFSATGGVTGCLTFLQANQTITLTGAVTGSGATTIATTFTTSTLYGLFSAGTGISFNGTNGTITNTGVTSAVAGGCVTVSNATGTVTFGSTCLTGTKVDSLNSITGAAIVAGTGPIVVASSSQTITVSCPTCGTGTVTTSSAGTANTLPIWTSGSALGNSGISQNGTSTYINNSSTYLGTNSSTTTSSLIWVSNYTGAGYWDATGTPISVSSCGSSPTIVGNMDRSRLVVGSGIVASCTLTFPIAFKNVPSVLMSGESSISGLAYTPTTSTLTITGTSLTSDAIDLSVEGIGE